MKFLSTSTLLAAGLLQLTSASDLRDESGDVWKSLLGSSGVEKRQSTWAPPSNLVKPLQEVWDHEMNTYNNGNALGFKNYGYDILMAANGYVSPVFVFATSLGILGRGKGNRNWIAERERCCEWRGLSARSKTDLTYQQHHQLLRPLGLQGHPLRCATHSHNLFPSEKRPQVDRPTHRLHGLAIHGHSRQSHRLGDHRPIPLPVAFCIREGLYNRRF